MPGSHRTGLPVAFLFAAALAGCEPGAAMTHTSESLFSNNCAPCHGASGGGDAVMALAPSIAGLPEWYVTAQLEGFREGLRGRHYDDVQGMRMRPMALTLSDDEVGPVASHVASLPRPTVEPTLQGGDAEKGKQYYAVCTACHGPEGAGNEALGSPPLVGASDWYLANQLGAFKAGVRGTHPKDARGAQMRPMASTLPDEQAIKDVLAYIGTLSR